MIFRLDSDINAKDFMHFLPGHVAGMNSQIDLEMIRVVAFQIPFSYFWRFEALLLYL